MKKCDKLTVKGEICGAKPGTCIHDYKPTMFITPKQTA